MKKKKSLFFGLLFPHSTPKIIFAYPNVWHAVNLSERHVVETAYLEAKINKGHLFTELAWNIITVRKSLYGIDSPLYYLYFLIIYSYFLFEKDNEIIHDICTCKNKNVTINMNMYIACELSPFLAVKFFVIIILQ